MGNVVSFASARRFIADGYHNVMSRLGVPGVDRNAGGAYFVPVLSQAQIEAAYRSSWLTRKVHDLPAFEMTRTGRRWQAADYQIEALEKAERALGLWDKLRSAIGTARLHGGAALVLGVRQGSPEQPLNVEALRKDSLRYAIVVSRHQLHTPQGFDWNPESDQFMAPAMWELRGARGDRVSIHPSRVITFHGAPVPAGAISTSQIDQFWGDPLLLSIKSAIDNAEVSQAAIATLLHEMKMDVVKIPHLTETIASADAESAISARIEAITRLKSMFNALLLDGGDENGNGGEEWEHRQTSFAQHPELIRAFVGIVAGAADIPVTRLMGEAAGGLQSTGKGEQADFNRMIDARRDADLRGPLARLDEILLRSTLGLRPDDVYYEFGDLADADPKTLAEIEKMEAETTAIYVNTALVPTDAMAETVKNRLVESGRWPGLEKAIEASTEEEPDDEPELLPPAANENDVQQMEQRGAITRDQAMVLLADASPRSLYVRRDLVNVGEFREWAAAQGFTDIVGDLHVTLIHSRTPIDWMKAGEGFGWGGDDKGQLTVAPGGPRLVERFDGGAVVLSFSSTALQYRHEDIKRAGAEHGFAEYQPHVTITYAASDDVDLRTVEPYRGKLVFGPEVFEEVRD